MKTTLWSGVLSVGLAALVGCASDGPTPEEQKAREEAKQEAIEDILSKPLDAEEYAREERCLSLRAYDSVDILDDQHVVFRGRGDDEIWLNTLRHRCVGLRPNDVLQFEVQSSRVCDLDTFEAVDSFQYAIRSTCSLGTFTPVTPEQIEAIEMAVKESRGN